MDLEFTDDQQELRATVRSVLQRECPMQLVREVVEKGVAPDALWACMVELDWPALTIPSSCGGLGLGFIELTVLVEELGRAVAPGPFLATVTQFAPAVREAGTAEQQERFLGAVAAGQLTGALAVAEQAGDWDPATIACTARPENDGWVLDGTKCFVPDGARAEELVVAARVAGPGAGVAGAATAAAASGDDGIGLFVVPQPAVRSQPIHGLDASRQLATVELHGVRVDASRALGQPGRCRAALSRAIEEATAALAIELVGTCQAIFDIALDHAKVREQFGVPIGSFQAMKHKFTDMFVALERARAVCYFAALAIAEDDARRRLAAAMAKAAAGECEELLAQEGIQSLGGIGYTWEHDMHLYVKRAKSSGALLGNAAAHRARVAELVAFSD